MVKLNQSQVPGATVKNLQNAILTKE